jgi:hypothetical protein
VLIGAPWKRKVGETISHLARSHKTGATGLDFLSLAEIRFAHLGPFPPKEAAVMFLGNARQPGSYYILNLPRSL